MSVYNKRLLYLLFFVSGFCSLVYQMVWTRLAFASFGIITPVLSVVLSVFMLGLAVGSWLGGKIIAALVKRSGRSAIFFYGGAECIIGIGAFATPGLFALGRHILLNVGQTDSFQYLLLSALVLAASILPWCLCMGATFPWMMAYVREDASHPADSFSYLYFANVLGAMTGTLITAFVLIETLGFKYTLALAAVGNFLIAALSAGIGLKARAAAPSPEAAPVAPKAEEAARSSDVSSGMIKWILFTTGFCTMAMEVVWTRAFTPVLKTQVYSFALIVFTYLTATFIGSGIYRRDLERKRVQSTSALMALLGLSAFLPIMAVDPKMVLAFWDLSAGYNTIYYPAMARVLLSICPVCGVLGYLTPSLIDQYAAGQPAEAGKAYGLNVLGCILGPLVASYVLLPNTSERYALVILGVPLLALGFAGRQAFATWPRIASAAGSVVALLWCLFFADDFEGYLQKRQLHTTVRRDYAASVISYGEDFGRRLLVNGIGMTILTAETKTMVHLPLAALKKPPESILIICFGMGTSFRAALSWDIDTTAVELVPSVVQAFPFYHADTAAVLANPKGHIVIDDGRRFLARTRAKYDVIVIDPPPPVEAAGSSLLYSTGFYDLAKEHLKPGGILQIWFPGGPKGTSQAVMRSLSESFPYVRGFRGIHGWGAHFLGAMQPLDGISEDQLVARMPAKAQADIMEWIPKGTAITAQDCFRPVVSAEADIKAMLNPDKSVEITDDQPFNEYFMLRSWGGNP